MTLYNKKTLDDKNYLRKLSIVGKRMNINVVAFSPLDVLGAHNKVNGHVYDIRSERWRRVKINIPPIVFDRSRFKSTPQFKRTSWFRKKYRNVIFLNKPMAHKWKIHELFASSNKLKKHLPHTILYTKKKDFLNMIAAHPILFFKPVNGTGGRGILCIKKDSPNTFIIEGRNHQRKIIPTKRLSTLRLLELLEIYSNRNKYILQQSIDTKLDNGRVHDYRLLIQKNGAGKWEVTGCAGRIGPVGSVTSNLHGGGTASPYESLLSKWITSETKRKDVKEQMEDIAHACVESVEERFGSNCELAIDIAVDENGNVWLLEINPKPGREIFAKIGDKTTYTLALKRPLEYAQWLYDNQHNP